MKYHDYLTRRYLSRRWAPWAATVAVALGVFSLLTVLAVMEGFKVEMRERIRGTLSHLVIEADPFRGLVGEDPLLRTIESIDGVKAAAPHVTTLALYKVGVMDHCVLRGVEPAAECEVSDLARFVLSDDEINEMLKDRFMLLPADREPMPVEQVEQLFSLERRRDVLRWRLQEDPGSGFSVDAPPKPFIVGIEALRSGRLSMGDVVQISSYSPITLEPCSDNFIVVGAFQSGVYEQDLRWAYTHIRSLQDTLELWDEEAEDMRLSGISIKLDDYSQADRIKGEIRREVDRRMFLNPDHPDKIPLRSPSFETWEDKRANLIQAVEIEKRIISVLMLLIVAFAAGMIFLILMLLVIEKERDLGVLRALGATRSGVVSLVLRQGMFLCTAGAAVGLLAGWAFLENINGFHDLVYQMTGLRLFPPNVYYLERIPMVLRWQDVLLVSLPTLIFGFFGSILPAIRAGRHDPIKALHHE